MRKHPIAGSHSSAPRYNTKAVVRDTGVPADTFRAWERRYGVPMPHRTPGGQRLYSERDVVVIRWLRDRTAEGLTISQAVRLLESDAATTETTALPVAWPELERQLVEALLGLDAPRAEAVMSEAFAHYPLDDVCLKLIQPAFVTIGVGWHSGSVSIGQEHFATQFMRRRLQALLGVYDVVDGHATIVAACAPGEQHDMGLLILALMLVRRAYRVIYLGPDVPSDGLAQVVEQVDADLVCLSAASETTFDAANVVARVLKAAARPPVVVIGGQGVPQGTSANELYIPLKGDAIETAEQIGALLATGTSTDEKE